MAGETDASRYSIISHQPMSTHPLDISRKTFMCAKSSFEHSKSHLHLMHTSLVHQSRSECYCLCLGALMQLLRKNYGMLLTGRLALASI